MALQPLLKPPVQVHPNIAWGALNSDGKLVGHRDWQEIVIVRSDGHVVCTIPEPASATHFIWTADGSEFAYICDGDVVTVFKREKYNTYVDEGIDETTCAPDSLCYFLNASGSTSTLMFETKAANRRGKQDTFTLVGNRDAEMHISGACADKTCIYGIDTDDRRLTGYPHVRNLQCFLFETHEDDARPDHNRCATNGHQIVAAGDTALRMYKIGERDVQWQVPASVLGVPFFVGKQSVATLEHNGNGLVIRDAKTGDVQNSWGIPFTLRALASTDGQFVVLNMGDGSTQVFDSFDLCF